MSGNVSVQGTSTSRTTGGGSAANLASLKQYSVIRPDSDNNSLQTIQVVRDKLIELGRLAPTETNPDTFFEAVRQYQQDKGLKVDGIVGQQTLASLLLGDNSVAPGTKHLSKAPVADPVPEFKASPEFIQTHYDEYVAGDSGADGAGATDSEEAQAASMMSEEEFNQVMSRAGGVVGGVALAGGTALALRNLRRSGQLATVPARARAATQAARQLATQGGAKAAAAGARSALQAAGAALKANPGAVLKGVAGKALPIAGVLYGAYHLKDQLSSDKATWKKVANGVGVVAGACMLIPGIGWGAGALLFGASVALSMV